MSTRNMGLLLCAMLGAHSCVTSRSGDKAAPVGTTFYVAPRGSDTNPGTKRKPFATLKRARDAIRDLKKAGTLPIGGVTVFVRGGVYELAEPLEFTAEDSGTEECPIVYRPYKGKSVRIMGGRTVSGWRMVDDRAILARLAPKARDHVFQTDLKALGITDLQGINSPRRYASDPGLELFFDDKPMTLARYPNEGYMRISDVLDSEGEVVKSGSADTPEGRFLCDDPRPARWSEEEDVWLHGFWVRDWADERIPLGTADPDTQTISFVRKRGRRYGLRRNQWFYAENVLAELDMPGEWYLNRDTGMLYFWPPNRLSDKNAVVSVVRDLIQLENVSHVTFRGLLVEAGRGSAFVVKGGENVRIVACTVRNMGNWAIRVTGGRRHGVVGCDIYRTGQGGIHLEGGDRKTLTPAGHYADNNHIHHTSRWDPVYQQAIALYGVGNSATHNLIDNVPHIAIGFSHNDMTIEYNEIHSSVFQSNDAGAVYTSPPSETWSMRGHKIRYNYLHNIHGFEGRGCNGVYLDDCFSSADISHNIFYDVASRAILIGGGRDNPITNNMFINCRSAFSIDARGLGWAKGVGKFATKELHDLDYKQPPWSEKYPELLNILEDEPLAPKGNVVARNICWGGRWGTTHPQAIPLVKFEDNLTEEDPCFAGEPPEDFQLADSSPALKAGFVQIPFGKIGLYVSPDRASWPVQTVLREDPAPAPKLKPPRRVRTGPKPTFAIPRRKAPITIDGKLTPEEWFGLDPKKGLILQEGVYGEQVATPSKAWLAWDDQALHVAFDNAVDKEIPMKRDDTWGANDAVEVALSDPKWGKRAPILVLRAFTNGRFVSSPEAGARADVVRKAGENVQCAARIVDPGRWVVEMRIPLASLGIEPAPKLRLPLNLAVRKQGPHPWVMWCGTNNCTWYVPEAGRVHFIP